MVTGNGMKGPDKKSGADSLSPQENPEKKAPTKYDFQSGQVWIRSENDFRLEIAKKNNSGFFEVLLNDASQKGRTKLEVSKTELKKMIASGYVLLAPDVPSADTKEAAPDNSAPVAEAPVPASEVTDESASSSQNKVGAPLEIPLVGEVSNSHGEEKKRAESGKKFKSLVDAMNAKKTLQEREETGVENGVATGKQELEEHIEHSLAVGQKWQTKNGASRLEITQQRKDGALGVVRSVRADKNENAWTNEKMEFLKSQDVEKKLLLEKYALISGTAVLPDKMDEARYLSLSKEMATILEEEINPVRAAIAKTLEVYADTLGDQRYHGFFNELDRISALTKDIFEQDDWLYSDTKKDYAEALTAVQGMKEQLVGLREELKRLRVSIDRAIKEADTKNEGESLGKSGNVVDIANYRKMSESASEPVVLPQRVVETKKRSNVKEVMDVEAKVGKEKYKALSQFVEDIWKFFVEGLKGTASTADRDNEWKASLPRLQKEIKDFLQGETDLDLEECERVCKVLVEKITKKKVVAARPRTAGETRRLSVTRQLSSISSTEQKIPPEK